MKKPKPMNLTVRKLLLQVRMVAPAKFEVGCLITGSSNEKGQLPQTRARSRQILLGFLLT
jgi:hypothetical protein